MVISSGDSNVKHYELHLSISQNTPVRDLVGIHVRGRSACIPPDPEQWGVLIDL